MTASAPVHGRSLVSDDLFIQIARRVVEHNTTVTPDLAERATDQTLAFLVTSAHRPGLWPSQLVDKGWHAFLLDTPAYSSWCQQHAGGFNSGCGAGPPPRQ